MQHRARHRRRRDTTVARTNRSPRRRRRLFLSSYDILCDALVLDGGFRASAPSEPPVSQLAPAPMFVLSIVACERVSPPCLYVAARALVRIFLSSRRSFLPRTDTCNLKLDLLIRSSLQVRFLIIWQIIWRKQIYVSLRGT